METQLRMISKEEAHQLIDKVPGDNVMILSYSKNIGISDNGKYIKKNRGKKLVDKANVLVLAENKLILTLNLHNKCIGGFSYYSKEKIDKSILFPKLE